jgi:putative ABC transport system permease protein
MPEWRAEVRRRLSGAGLDPAREGDVLEELVQHLEERQAELLAGGASPNEARAAVLAELDAGNVLGRRLREVARARSVDPPVAGAEGRGFLADLWHDLRYAGRALRKNRGFTVVTLLSLTLGIGANTAFFQFLVALHLRALPVAEPEELAIVRIRDRTWASGSPGAYRGSHHDLTNPLWEQIRARQRAFSGVFAWGDRTFNLAPTGEVRRVRALMVSGEYFHVLGVPALRGRVFTAADDRPGCADPGVVVSHGFWQRGLGGDPSVVGRMIPLDGRSYPVVGVTPPIFSGLEIGKSFDVALPLCSQGANLEDRHSWWLSVVGRLKPGWTLARASAHLEAISKDAFATTVSPGYRPENAASYRQFRLGAYSAATGISQLRERYTTPLSLLLGIAALVLLIACANLASLLLARATAREREIAVRLALGASRGRLIRQLMVESLLLAGLGAGLGGLLARVLSQQLMKVLGTRIEVVTDWRVLVFTTALGGLTALIFGLVPALRASRAEVALVLRSAAGRSTTSRRDRFGVRRMLVSGQIALSFVLLLGALLFARSLRNLLTVDSGFREQGVLVVHVNPVEPEIPRERRIPFKRELLDRLRSTPGLRAVAATTIVPLGGSGWDNPARLEGGVPSRNVVVNFSRVSPGYFQTLETPLVAGRDFTDTDGLGSLPVAIVSRQFARELAGGANVVGRHFHVEGGTTGERVYQIVGIVGDTKYASLREELAPVAYLPLAQDEAPTAGTTLLVRTELPTDSAIGPIKNTVVGIAPRATMTLSVLERMMRQSTSTERLMAILAGFFGLLAALLAAVGLYGVVSYSVARRTPEIGIRMALGATERKIAGMILGEAAELLSIGLAAGIVLSLVAGRAAGAVLYGLEPYDPLTVTLALLLMAIVAFVASLLPARRVARVDPLRALREE